MASNFKTRPGSVTGEMMDRYKVYCKDEKHFTYAVFDCQTNCWVADTECATLEAAQIYADKFNVYNNAKAWPQIKAYVLQTKTRQDY